MLFAVVVVIDFACKKKTAATNKQPKQNGFLAHCVWFSAQNFKQLLQQCAVIAAAERLFDFLIEKTLFRISFVQTIHSFVSAVEKKTTSCDYYSKHIQFAYFILRVFTISFHFIEFPLCYDNNLALVHVRGAHIVHMFSVWFAV